MSVSSVFKALGKIAVNTAAVGVGVMEETSNIAAGVIHDTAKIGNLATKAFTNRSGSYIEHLKQGQLIPIRLKRGLGAAGAGAMIAYGAASGIARQEGPEETLQKVDNGEYQYSQIPNTLNKMFSPKQQIDDMGADGNIVLAQHGNR